MNEKRDWKKEGNQLYNIYLRRGYQKEVAFDMMQQEITKRKVECGYPVDTVEEHKEDSEHPKSQKKR